MQHLDDVLTHTQHGQPSTIGMSPKHVSNKIDIGG